MPLSSGTSAGVAGAWSLTIIKGIGLSSVLKVVVSRMIRPPLLAATTSRNSITSAEEVVLCQLVLSAGVCKSSKIAGDSGCGSSACSDSVGSGSSATVVSGAGSSVATSSPPVTTASAPGSLVSSAGLSELQATSEATMTRTSNNARIFFIFYSFQDVLINCVSNCVLKDQLALVLVRIIT